MSEKISIRLPISKAYLNTFINSFCSIHFLQDQSFSLESLKNLLFPPQHPDKEFNELVEFIKIIFEEFIKNNKNSEEISNELHQIYDFESDMLNSVMNVLNTRRTEILNKINSKFFHNQYLYTNLNWNLKSILSASKEDYYTEKFSDLEFIYSNMHNEDFKKLAQKNITFTKKDISKTLNELKKIKENLKKIN